MNRIPYAAIWAGICLIFVTAGQAPAFAASAVAIPDCAGPVEVSKAHIVRVEKNGALILSDGRAALLEGIRLPIKDDRISDDAMTALRALATAGPLQTLTATRPKEDRYDRIRVQAFGDDWLQMELLRRGLAQVSIAPDRSECAPDFYEAEAAARAAGLGLWALASYAVRAPGSIGPKDVGAFRIVEGKVTDASTHDGQVYIDFSADWRHSLSATVAPDDRKPFRTMGFDFDDLNGKRIRLRGIVTAAGTGYEIALSNPAQVEVIN